MSEEDKSLKVTLILTNRVQIRSWLSKESLEALMERFQLSIYAPRTIQNELDSYKNELLVFNYYEVPNRLDLERNLFACLITFHLSWSSFRRRFKYEFYNQGNFIGIFNSTRRLIRSVNRNIMLLRCSISSSYRNFIMSQTNNELKEFSFGLTPSDIILVVSNQTDLANEIAIHAATKSGTRFIQIVENWDNLSSKLCPARNASKLIVWGQQTKKFAIDIHGMNKDKVLALGSSRIPSTVEIDHLKALHKRPPNVGREFRVFYPGYGGENEDESFIQILYAEISREFPDYDIKIVFRPHPLSIKAKGMDFYSNWPSYVELDFPIIEFERGSDWPKLDESIYRAMLQSDVVIGSPSTFLLEAMIFNVPIVLDMRTSVPRFHSHHDRFVTASHFKEILADDRIPRFKNQAEIGKAIKRAFYVFEDYSSLTEFILHNDHTCFIERLVPILHEIRRLPEL